MMISTERDLMLRQSYVQALKIARGQPWVLYVIGIGNDHSYTHQALVKILADIMLTSLASYWAFSAALALLPSLSLFSHSLGALLLHLPVVEAEVRFLVLRRHGG